MKYSGDRTKAELVLKEQNIGRLGMFKEDYPYVVPICFVYEQGNIYLHSKSEGQKLDCIEKNNNVCLQVDQVSKLLESDSACKYDFNYRSVIVLGKAEEVKDSEMKLSALKMLARQFAGEEQVKKISKEDMKGVVVIKINIEEVNVKISEKENNI